MGNKIILSTRLAEEITKSLDGYKKDVVEGLNAAGKKISGEAVKELKEESPKRTGEYSKNWATMEQKATNENNKYITHNKEYYQLTHILEKGHVLRGGGRVKGYPHIKKAEENAVAKYIKLVEGVIRK